MKSFEILDYMFDSAGHGFYASYDLFYENKRLCDAGLYDIQNYLWMD